MQRIINSTKFLENNYFKNRTHEIYGGYEFEMERIRKSNILISKGLREKNLHKGKKSLEIKKYSKSAKILKSIFPVLNSL